MAAGTAAMATVSTAVAAAGATNCSTPSPAGAPTGGVGTWAEACDLAEAGGGPNGLTDDCWLTAEESPHGWLLAGSDFSSSGDGTATAGATTAAC